MMLNPERLQLTHIAILDAFPSKNALRFIVQTELGEDLESIADGESLHEIITNLIAWAEEHGRLGDLVRGANEQNPNNALLNELWIQYQLWQLETNVALEAIDKSVDSETTRQTPQIDTGGGTYIGGSVSTNGGTYVGRDQVIHVDVNVNHGLTSIVHRTYRWLQANRTFVNTGLVTLSIVLSLLFIIYVDEIYRMSLESINRYRTNYLIRRGEEFAKIQNYTEATKSFEAALSLEPPVDTKLYVWIDPGMSIMGNQSDMAREDEMAKGDPISQQGFWITRTEITNRQYRECVKANECSELKDNEQWNNAKYNDFPVIRITWSQARQYATWAGGRLPTEAEWEFACRGPNGYKYPWGPEELDANKLNYEASFTNEITPVGSYEPSINGLYDIVGNVWEWTQSRYDDETGRVFFYPYDPTDGREELSASGRRVIRGGSFLQSKERVTCTARGQNRPGTRADSYGFRIISCTGANGSICGNMDDQ